MPDALDGDFSRSRAVLMGTWNYEHLQLVASAENSFRRMRRLLTGPECGAWPESSVLSIEDPRAENGIRRQLIDAFAEAQDVALFYFVGHGLVDYRSQLCLAVGGTSAESRYVGVSSLAFEHVQEAFAMSGARVKVAILDCCFSGIAGDGPGRLSAELPLPLSGSYLLMSSGAFSPSLFELPGESAHPQTYFTKYLLDVVEEGVPGRPLGLTLDDLFTATSRRLVEEGKPEPRRRIHDRASDWVMALNAQPAAPRQLPALPEPDPEALYEAASGLKEQNRIELLPQIKVLYRAAADAGHTRSMTELGLIAEGRTTAKLNGYKSEGTEDPDLVGAVYWYTRAAAADDRAAPLALGRIYEEHYGDYREALHWYDLSARRGNGFARERLDGLRQRLDLGLMPGVLGEPPPTPPPGPGPGAGPDFPEHDGREGEH